MLYEKSCGVIVYKMVQGIPHYLIIRALNGECGFPKGHMEREESEYETAIREVKEETGVDVRIIEGFREETEYPLLHKPGVMKQTVYFIGECLNDKITCQQTEVSEAGFVPAAQAIALLSFQNTRDILQAAEAWLCSVR